MTRDSSTPSQSPARSRLRASPRAPPLSPALARASGRVRPRARAFGRSGLHLRPRSSRLPLAASAVQGWGRVRRESVSPPPVDSVSTLPDAASARADTNRRLLSLSSTPTPSRAQTPETRKRLPSATGRNPPRRLFPKANGPGFVRSIKG